MQLSLQDCAHLLRSFVFWHTVYDRLGTLLCLVVVLYVDRPNSREQNLKLDDNGASSLKYIMCWYGITKLMLNDSG